VFQFDLRSLPELEIRDVVRRIENSIRAQVAPAMQAVDPAIGVRIESVIEVRGLTTDTGHPAEVFLKRLLGREDHAKVAYCTEASLFGAKAGIVSLVCGPGSMQQGHKADEVLALSQVEACESMIERLADQLERSDLSR
jgi:acetylornithine deacetylase